MQIHKVIKPFINSIKTGKIEVYNEFSLQHELGIFLRTNVSKLYKVQFERNVSHFGFNKKDFNKKEIDISIFKSSKKPLHALELKYPRNGQYPEQMFSCCQDISFIESLRQAGFKSAYLIIFAEDPLYYSKGKYSKGDVTGIYGYFRDQKLLSGIVKKPTGRKNKQVAIKGQYTIAWVNITPPLKYTIIEVK